MDDPYYSPHPLLTLPRPLVLLGHPGSGVELVGRALVGRSGLTFGQVERMTEARAGRSRARILMEDGSDGLRELERAALERSLRRQPCGIVVVETALLLLPRARALLRAATTVHLARPLPFLLRRLRAQLEDAPGSCPEFLLGAPDTPEELGRFLQEREQHLAQLDWILHAGERPASTVAGDILAGLDSLVSAEAAPPA